MSSYCTPPKSIALKCPVVGVNLLGKYSDSASIYNSDKCYYNWVVSNPVDKVCSTWNFLLLRTFLSTLMNDYHAQGYACIMTITMEH